MHGSTNISPIKLNMQRKINWHSDLFTNGKTYTIKTPLGDFKVQESTIIKTSGYK